MAGILEAAKEYVAKKNNKKHVKIVDQGRGIISEARHLRDSKLAGRNMFSDNNGNKFQIVQIRTDGIFGRAYDRDVLFEEKASNRGLGIQDLALQMINFPTEGLAEEFLEKASIRFLTAEEATALKKKQIKNITTCRR